jgi:hypothetical protein
MISFCAGLSKFLGGMLGAAFSPRLMLALGLIATSGINVAFGFTTGVWWWTLLWAMNGGIQVCCCCPLVHPSKTPAHSLNCYFETAHEVMQLQALPADKRAAYVHNLRLSCHNSCGCWCIE